MLYRTNKSLIEIAKMVGLSIPLTLYVAHHSWASIAKSKNIPISVISEGMGHDSEMTTQIYLASLDNAVVDRANAQILKDLQRVRMFSKMIALYVRDTTADGTC